MAPKILYDAAKVQTKADEAAEKDIQALVRGVVELLPSAELTCEYLGAQKNSSEMHFAPTLGEIFSEVCWCLSDRDVLHLAASARVFESKVANVGVHLRDRSELLLHDRSGIGGPWCSLSFQEVAAYLRAIAPLSITTASNVSIHQRSRCPPLFARRIHSSLLSMLRSFGESADPMVLTLASFRFDRVDIEDCLHMRAEPQVQHFSVDAVILPSCSLKLHMTLEVSDLQDMELGTRARARPRVELNFNLDSGILSPHHVARDRGAYTVMARSLRHIGTERQVELRSTASIAANGAQFGSSKPYELSENCWAHHALRHGNPLFFFVVIWKTEPGSSFEHFEDLFS